MFPRRNAKQMLKITRPHISDEQEVLAGFNKRNSKAFCCIYEKYYNELYYFARKLFNGNPEISASDAVQDLFLKIWESDRQFDSLDILKSYLYLSIRNRWKNLLEHADSVKKYAATQDAHPTDDYILSAIIESETLAILHHQLNTLPPACAQVIRLCLQGFSQPEIAEKLNLSIHTVYSQKQKAIQLLRNLLSPDMLHLLFFLLNTKEK